jgi:potassium efflux system protein
MTVFLPYRTGKMICLTGFLCAAMLILGNIARAADETGSSPPVDAPIRLSTADIEQRSDAVRDRLGVAQKAINDSEFDVDVLERELAEFEAAVTQVKTSISEDLATFNPLVFDRIRQTLTSQQAQAEGWNAEFSAHTGQLADLRSALLTDAEFFKELMNSDQFQDLPTVLADNIGVLRGDIDAVRDQLAKDLNDSVSLRGRIADYQTEIDATLEQLENAVTGRRGRIVGFGHEPLLKSLRGPYQPPVAALVKSWEILGGTWTDYVAQHRPELISVVALLPVLLLVVWFLRASSLDKADSAIYDSAHSIFVQRPLATIIVIWLGLGAELLMIRLPWVLSDITSVFVMLAMLRLLSAVIQPNFVGPVRGLLLLALFVVTTSIIYPAGSAHRAIIFGAEIAAIPILMRLATVSGSLRSEDRSGQPGLVAWLAKAGILAIVVAIATDLYGAVGIAEQLVYAVLITNIVIVAVLALELAMRTGWAIFLESKSVGRLNAVRRHPTLIHRRGVFLIRILLILFVISVLPNLFSIVDLFGDSIADFVTQEWAFGSLKLSINNLLVLAVGLLLAIYIPRLVRFIMDEDIVPRLPVDPGSGAAATRLTYYVLVLVGIALALASAGLEFGQVALIIGALGVGIGFGLQNIVNDFVSGIVVAFERPFQVGDTIEVGALWGRVRSIGLRASTIRTFEGAEVIVPNASLISGQVINWTLSDRRRRIDIPVGVAYGSDPEQVQEILVQAVTGHPACLSDPPPKALFREFGESALNFELRFWTPDAEQRLDTVSDVSIRINEALNAAGITIPFPQRDLHIRPATGKDVSID